MKARVTKKGVMNGYCTVISVGYCNIQTLLKYETPHFYTSGINGWNADIYEINGIAIVTGYNPFGNYNASYEVCNEWETRAERLYNTHYDNREFFRDLIGHFIEEVKNEG